MTGARFLLYECLVNWVTVNHQEICVELIVPTSNCIFQHTLVVQVVRVYSGNLLYILLVLILVYIFVVLLSLSIPMFLFSAIIWLIHFVFALPQTCCLLLIAVFCFINIWLYANVAYKFYI